MCGPMLVSGHRDEWVSTAGVLAARPAGWAVERIGVTSTHRSYLAFDPSLPVVVFHGCVSPRLGGELEASGHRRMAIDECTGVEVWVPDDLCVVGVV